MPRTSVPSRCWAEPREYVMFEDTGNPRPIDRGSRFDCDWDVTEQAGPPSEERCHNVAKTGVDSRIASFWLARSCERVETRR